jgi:hypothetical protein
MLGESPGLTVSRIALGCGNFGGVDYRPSFVDGSGSRRVLDSMWPLVAPLVDDAVAVPVAEVAAAVRTLAEQVRVIAEGPAPSRRRGYDAFAVDLPADDESKGLPGYADAVVSAIGVRATDGTQISRP